MYKFHLPEIGKIILCLINQSGLCQTLKKLCTISFFKNTGFIMK